jgi:hypothetical protein
MTADASPDAARQTGEIVVEIDRMSSAAADVTGAVADRLRSCAGYAPRGLHLGQGDVASLRSGDRVMAILQYGGLAEFAAAPAKTFFLPAMLQPAAPDLFRRHFVTGEVL